MSFGWIHQIRMEVTLVIAVVGIVALSNVGLEVDRDILEERGKRGT